MKLWPHSKEGEAGLAEQLNSQSNEDEPLVLMTSLRYDPHLKHLTRRVPIAMEDSDDDVFFLSKLHHRRLKYGAKMLRWDDVQISHDEMITKMHAAVASDKLHPHRVRLTVNRSGELEASASPVAERDDLFSGLSTSPPKDDSLDPVFDVLVGGERYPAKVTNMIKTTNRTTYDEIRKHLRGNQEVLMVGSNGTVLEGSLTSVAVKQNNEWITPQLEHGGMVGTTRSLLLGLGFVREGTILASDLKVGDEVLLFNGVQGVVSGSIVDVTN